MDSADKNNVIGELHYLEQELQALFKSDNDIYNFIAHAALDGIWFWDLQNPENEWMNDQFWWTLGYDPQQKQHLASEWQDLINEEDLQTALDNFHAHCDDPNHPYDQIVRYRHADQSTVWIRCRGLVIRDLHGEPVRMLGAHIDVTELKEAEQRYHDSLKEIDRLYAETKIALEASEQVFDAIPDAVFQVANSGDIVKVNEQACSMLGYSRAELEQMNIDALVPEAHRGNHPSKRERYFKQGYSSAVTKMGQAVAALRKDGTHVPVNIRLSSIETQQGSHVLALLRDISATEALKASLRESQSEMKQLYEQMIRDDLTSTFNRSYFLKHAEIELERAKRLQTSVTLLMLDIDNFKEINDVFGHQQGDQVLQQISQIITDNVRAYDIFARYGGEEFIVFMPETSQSAAISVCQRIIDVINQTRQQSMQSAIQLPTISIGLCGMDSNQYNLEELIKHADDRLLHAKRTGKNKLCY